jgi:DNA-directed RNA polymerase subunit alpha
MINNNIVLPSKPRIVQEKDFSGVYEIDNLYPGYGHTLGNSLRRIILSSLPGVAVTGVKIAGVSHEFSTINGVKEDVVLILLNLKKLMIECSTDEPQTLNLKIKGEKKVTAKDIQLPGQVKILNPELVIAHLTDKKAELDMEIFISKGLGYVPKEALHKERVEVGTITVDAAFTPIRRVSYEVENMRVGERTDFNRLRFFIETNGTISPKEVLEKAIEIMIHQLKAVVGFKEVEEMHEEEVESLREDIKKEISAEKEEEDKDEEYSEFLKTRVESLNFSSRTENALIKSNIRTVGGLVRKSEEDILSIDGLGGKGVQEIKRALSNFGLTLKS